MKKVCFCCVINVFSVITLIYFQLGNQTASMSSINSIITEERSNVWDALEGARFIFSLKFKYIVLILELVNNNEKDNIINNNVKIIRHTTCTKEQQSIDIFYF